MDDELGAPQKARIDSLWASLDPQRRGQLDFEALKKGLKRIDHPLKDADELLREVIRTVDSDGDGRIRYEEFCNFIVHAEKQLWVLFKSIDRDHDNQIKKDELRNAYNRAGISVSASKLDDFFNRIDRDHDGAITFQEWRDFLLFVPARVPGLTSILTYFTATVKVNPEGDVHVGDEAIQSLGTWRNFVASFFGVFSIFHPSRKPRRTTQPSPPPEPPPPPHGMAEPEEERGGRGTFVASKRQEDVQIVPYDRPPEEQSDRQKRALTAFLPNLGYFLAGGISGMVSRTATAPLDRLRVYLIAQTGGSSAVEAAKQGSVAKATKHAFSGLADACKDIWSAGGVRSFFAGNGLNVVKVMPESAIKFGSYEASKRLVARLEGHNDPQNIHPWSKFVAGGMGGIISQFCVYPIDTLKFRMQCETVPGSLHGNALIMQTFQKMWRHSGLTSFYRGLPMGLVGMFPYSAIDLGTFEYLKRWVVRRNMLKRGCTEEEAAPSSVITACIGGFSGAIGASSVYPLNLLRTRLQTQGTATHPRTYTGIIDVTRQTIKGEGVRGLFKGLTPNLLKVVPAVSITWVVYENSKKLLNLH